MKSKLLAVLLLAGTSMFAGPRVFFGLGVGPVYAPAPVVAYANPPAPVAAAYAWRPGYWARPPYAGAYWVGPRWEGHRYYGGYWHRR